MRKRFFLCLLTGIMLSVNAHAKYEMDLDVIGRFDINPQIALEKDEPNYFGFGNSVLYTLFQGTAGDHFGWCLINHWLDTATDSTPFGCTKYLYQGAFRSDMNNFVDYCYVEGYLAGFTLRLGKSDVALGGFEFNDYDWDVNYDNCSLSWAGTAAYQWGASLNYTTPSKKTNILAQFAASPFGEHPFTSGMFSYSFLHSGTYGCFETKNSVNYIQNKASSGLALIRFGGIWHVGDKVNLCLDANIAIDTARGLGKVGELFNQNTQFMPTVEYIPSDLFGFVFDLGFEKLCHGYGYTLDKLIEKQGYADTYIHHFGALTANMYPLRNNTLRLSWILGYGNYYNSITFTVGVTYHPTFHFSKK